MKYYKKIIGSLLVFAWLLMTGCLKDEDVDDGRIGVKTDPNSKIAEMMGPLSGLVVRTLEASSSEVTFTAVSIRLAAKQPAQTDVQVTLAVNNTAVTDYNTAKGTNYVPLPANMYSIPSLTVSIPKGSRTADLVIKVVPNNLAGTPYALGFSIVSVADPSVKISGNYKTLVAAIGVKNEFEATYKAVGYFEHPTSPRAINTNKYVSTVGANSSESLLGDLAGVYVVLTVNADNTVGIAPGTGTSGTTASVAKIDGDPVYNNKYDPATRTFKLKYGYPNPGPTRIITETLTRQ